MITQEISQYIKHQAIEIGFDACGIAKAEPLPDDAIHLQNWLHAGFHAGMNYMENNFEKRTDPSKLVEGSKSVVVVLLNYFPSNYPFNEKPIKITRYALGQDYHIIIKEKLKKLFNKIKETEPSIKGRVFVDSAPVLERRLAQKAGLGWIGKNSMLISKQFGSFCFIGELFLNMELEYDVPFGRNHCGTCQKCITFCPTKAIVEPGFIDSGKCISYQTIENKNPIPEDVKSKQNGWVFGCDICQEACPWNSKAKQHNTPGFNPLETITSFSYENIAMLNEKEFDIKFKGSPLIRAGLNGLLKNMQV